MRKAQIEMMGLVVVVILVTLGLFFSIALQPKPETKKNIEVYSNEKLAGDFLITLLETDLPGSNIMLRDLAVDCVRTETSATPKYRINNKDSCEAFEALSEDIINRTLERWGYGYHLTYTYDAGGDSNTPELVTLGQPCEGERTAPGIQPISLFRVAPGRAVLELHLCR